MSGNQIMAAMNQMMVHVATIVGWAFILLIAGKVAQMFGVRIPMVPSINDTALLYTAGAWWLVRK